MQSLTSLPVNSSNFTGLPGVGPDASKLNVFILISRAPKWSALELMSNGFIETALHLGAMQMLSAHAVPYNSESTMADVTEGQMAQSLVGKQPLVQL